jgi:hypothetical protein
MTTKPKDGGPAPEVESVRARDVQPYVWGIWCEVEGIKEPFVNTIMSVKWSDDGERIFFGLETHNFDSRKPEEEIELVPIPPKPHRANYPPFVLGPRPRWDTCDKCGHRSLSARSGEGEGNAD